MIKVLKMVGIIIAGLIIGMWPIQRELETFAYDA